MLSIQLIGILKTITTSAFKYTEGLAKSQAKIKNRYGFIQLDLTTQQRTIKKSGEWFAETSLNNSFDK